MKNIDITMVDRIKEKNYFIVSKRVVVCSNKLSEKYINFEQNMVN